MQIIGMMILFVFEINIDQRIVWIYQQKMSQIDKIRQPQRLFRYAIDQHISLDQQQKKHFYRVNRWRFNTFNRYNFLKYLKLKGPITFGISVTVLLDYTFGFYNNPAQH